MLAMLLGWSKWRDILVFNFAGQSYLLQGRVHSKTNLKKFRLTACKGPLDFLVNCGSVDEKKLERVNLFETKTN